MENSFNIIPKPDSVSEYFYTDNHDGKHGEVIFMCKAATIGEADELFEKKFGYDVRKDSSIGCIPDAGNEKWIEDYKEKHQLE